MNPNMWEIVGGIASIVGTFGLIYTLWLLHRQLKEMSTARSLEAIARVFEYLTSEDVSRARKEVLDGDLPAPGQVSLPHYEAMHKVWVSFDNLGVMIKHSMIPENIALDMFHTPAIRCWQKLEPYIQYERSTRPDPRYQIFFEELYDRSLKYRQRPHMKDLKSQYQDYSKPLMGVSTIKQ